MWVSKIFSGITADVDMPVVCDKHFSPEPQVLEGDTSKEDELYKVLLYVKIQALDPFLFLKPYSSKLLRGWAVQSGILSESGYISHDDVKMHKKNIGLVDCVISFSLTALTKVCFYCAKQNDGVKWFSNSADDAVTWQHLKHCFPLKDALKCIEKHKNIIEEINEKIELDENIIAAVFLITFMLRYETFENESVESICREVDGSALEIDKTFLYSNLIVKQHNQKVAEEYQHSIQSYSMLLKARPHSVIAFYNRCEAYLALGMYIDAELDGIRLVTMYPTLCKGYLKLASAFYVQGLLHSAHKIANVGQLNCKIPLNCRDCNLLKGNVEEWMSKCTQCKEYQQNISVSKMAGVGVIQKQTPILFHPANDIPDLIYSSDCEECEINNEQLENEKKSECSDLTDASCSGEDCEIDVKKSDCPPLTDGSLEYEECSEIEDGSIQVLQSVSSSCMTNSNKRKGKKTKRSKHSVSKEKELFSKATLKKHERSKRKKIPVAEKSAILCNTTEKQCFDLLLNEGLIALKAGSGHEALRKYHEALTEQKSNPTLYNLEDWDLTCLKYAYGFACCKSGTIEDLNKAIEVFSDVIKLDDPSYILPYGSYGLGIAYFKLNRFREAIDHFKEAETALNVGLRYPKLMYPGTNEIIKEADPDNLQVILGNLINKCKCPPPPLATCRFGLCPLTPEIYSTDNGFKGYFNVQCQDKCLLSYHPACWRYLKDSLHRTDKDFLSQHCLTPDCEFFINQVQCVGKRGTVDKEFTIEERFKKQKKSKFVKKSELKKIKKMHRQESHQVHIPVTESNDICGSGGPSNAEFQDVAVGEEQLFAKEAIAKSEICSKIPAKKVETNLSVDAPPFCFRKKDPDFDKKEFKHKDRRRSKKPAAIGVDEFCSKPEDFSYYSEYQKRLHILQENKRLAEDTDITHWSTVCETIRNPALDPLRPFHIPEVLREHTETLDAVLQSYNTLGETDVSKTLKESMFTYFEDILLQSGPMRLDDSRLLAIIMEFPSESQKLIKECGGLKNFLSQSMRFGVVVDHICVARDLVKTYSISSNDQSSENAYFCDEYDANISGSEDIIESGVSNGFLSYLNPHASEYNPSIPKRKYISMSSSLCSESCGNQHVETSNVCEAVSNAHDSSPCVWQKGDNDKFKNLENSLNSFDVSEFVLPEASTPIVENVHGAEGIADVHEIDSNEQEEHNHRSHFPCETSESGLTLSDANILVEKVPLGRECFSDSVNVSENTSRDNKMELKGLTLIVEQLQVNQKECISPSIPEKVLAEEYEILCIADEQHNKAVQVGNEPTEMLSKGVMKDDDTLNEVQAVYRDQVKALELRLKEVEEELEASINDSNKVKEKYDKAVMDLAESKKLFDCQLAGIKEDLKILADEKKQILDELELKNEQVVELKQAKEEAEEELKSERKARCEVESSLETSIESYEMVIAEIKKKAMDAELKIVTFKKETFSEKIELEIKNANAKIKELEGGLQMCEKNLPVVYTNDIWKLLSKMGEYVTQLKEIQSKFVILADEHLSTVREEREVSNIRPLVMPILPTFPSLQPLHLDDSEAPVSRMPFPILPSAALLKPHNPPVMQSVPSFGFNPLLPLFPKNQMPPPSLQDGFNFPGINPSLNSQNSRFPLVNQMPLSVSQRFTAETTRKPAPPGLNPQLHPAAVVNRSSDIIMQPYSNFSTNEVNFNHPLLQNVPHQVNPPVTIPSPLDKTENVCHSKSSELVKVVENEGDFSEHFSPVERTSKSTGGLNQVSVNPSGVLSTGTKPKSSICAKTHIVGKNDKGELIGNLCGKDLKPAVSSSDLESAKNEGSARSSHRTSFEIISLSRHSSVSVLSSVGENDGRTQHKSQAKSSYERLLVKLQGRYPQLSRSELMNSVTAFRQQHNNKLTGISLEAIVSGVTSIIESRNPRNKVPKPKVLVNKPSLPPRDPRTPPILMEKTSECPWANAAGSNKPKWQGGPSESSCVICFEEMDKNNTYRVDCGHTFHLKCIRAWLQNTSNCPVCRVHILLPEDYPLLD